MSADAGGRSSRTSSTCRAVACHHDVYACLHAGDICRLCRDRHRQGLRVPFRRRSRPPRKPCASPRCPPRSCRRICRAMAAAAASSGHHHRRLPRCRQPGRATMARLARWAKTFAPLQASPHTPKGVTIQLHSLVIKPRTLRIGTAASTQPPLTGQLSSGKSAPQQILSGPPGRLGTRPSPPSIPRDG